jgi:hypothetical protein
MKSAAEVIEKLASMGPARRGQLTEQSYTVTGKDGSRHEQGPYYVLTWSDDGAKRTKRVAAPDVERVREELARGREIDGLVLEFRRAKEAEADAFAQKKTTRRSSGRTEPRSSRRSTPSGKASPKGATSASRPSRRR